MTIKISDDLRQSIIDLYLVGKNREDIAKITNVTNWTVRKVLKGITRDISASLKLYHKSKSIPINESQKQLILGSLLGDASLIYDSDDDTIDFQVSHCEAQKEYLEYKAKVLGSNVLTGRKNINSYAPNSMYYKIYFHNKYELLKIKDYTIIQGRKTITEKWCSELSAEAIAYWYMDDGSSSYTKDKDGNHKNYIKCIFSTLSFKNEELILLQNLLKKFNINTSLVKHSDGEGLNINILSDSTNVFMDLIEPYIVPCMQYKIKRRTNEPNYKFRRKN